MQAKRKLSICIMACTNDEPTLETGVTEYNLSLVKKLCEEYPKNNFTIYLSPKNSLRFEGIKYSNLTKIVINNYVLSGGPLERKINIFLNEFKYKIGLAWKSILNNWYNQIETNHDIYMYTIYGLHTDFPLYINRLHQKKCISTIHDIRFLEINNAESYLRQKIVRCIGKFHLKRILDSSDMILLPSEYLKKKLKEIFVYKNISISFCVPRIISNDFEKFLKPDIPEKYLYYPATIVETKNHRKLIKILAILKEEIVGLKLILTGSNWDSPLGGLLKKEIKKLNLEGDVLHLGFVSEKMKHVLYKNAVCMVVPSFNESFNLGIWEAFGLGCPVVCSNDREIVEQVGGAALISRIDIDDELLINIKTFNKSKEVRLEYIKKGLERYKYLKNDSIIGNWSKIYFSN